MEKNKTTSNLNNKIKNSIISSISTKKSENSIAQYNQLGKPTLVDSIVSKVKEKFDNDLRMYIIIVIPILFLLGYIVYKYNFSSRSSNVITNMGYKKQIELQDNYWQ